MITMAGNPNKSDTAVSTTVRVAIVEDNLALQEQLVHQLAQSSDITCVGHYNSAEEALKEIPRSNPDVVLMDINLPKMNGVDCVRQLKALHPKTQFIMLTIYEDADHIFESLQAGAVGYLLKGRPKSGARLLEAVRDAVSGGSPLNSLIARKIIQYFSRPAATTSMQALTSREDEVLTLLAKGLLYKEIAVRLDVHIETVRKHCHNIYQKLQVNSRTEAVLKFLGR
ncbi:MAG: DNA-binding response regulator [Pedosphaera sp.]|nr:DNA-binding response regulator [Pedosphaera sp.]